MSQGGAAGNAIFFFVGYVGPSTFGLGAAKLIEIGHIVAVLWLTLILLAFLLASGVRVVLEDNLADLIRHRARRRSAGAARRCPRRS